MKEFAKSFYKSKRWQKTRNAYAAYVGWLCEECLQNGIYRPGEIVHHKKKLTPDNIDDPNIALSWNNLELLCRDCHAKKHEAMRNRRYRVNSLGKVTAIE